MNILTVKKKLFFCEVAIYIYEMERQERLTRPGKLLTFQTCRTFPTFLNVCPDCQAKVLADVPRQTFLV